MLMDSGAAIERARLLQRGELLEAATVARNVVEGIVAVVAGVLASSVALVGFGVDSFVETASGAVVGRRLHAELSGRADEERAKVLERRAGRIAGVLLLGLAVYIMIDAGRRLLGYGAEARQSVLGIVVTAISVVVTPFLGWAKLRTATALGSGALRADAYETITCSWLSLTTLTGLILMRSSGGGGLTRLRPSLSFRSQCEKGLEGWRGENDESY